MSQYYKLKNYFFQDFSIIMKYYEHPSTFNNIKTPYELGSWQGGNHKGQKK